MNNCSGYTLLEALIGLSIVVVVIVPLLSRLSGHVQLNHGEKLVTAACILEQESEIAICNPKEILPVKRRVINKKEWTIKTEKEGNGLVIFKMKISDKEKEISNMIFYGTEENKK
jgi:type II secretory pathway pseudopilin PulG